MKVKTKLQNFFALKKAVQYNILIKITKVLFDTHIISQKILGLATFFTEWKKPKNRTKAKIAKISSNNSKFLLQERNQSVSKGL